MQVSSLFFLHSGQGQLTVVHILKPTSASNTYCMFLEGNFFLCRNCSLQLQSRWREAVEVSDR